MGEQANVNARDIFKALSKELQAKFEKSAAVTHSGGKGDIREDDVRKFLTEYLPRRYAIGSGQIIQSENHVSRQCDIVIYDADHCPRLLSNNEHSYFPIESVFGVVEVKSKLTFGELTKAFENIRSVKSLVRPGSFTHGGPGTASGLERPIPVGIIFAYSADRSLLAIAKQVEGLRSTQPEQDPDFIAVLDLGLVGPTQRLRNEWNSFRIPKKEESSLYRETKEHTLLGFYLKLLNELNSITLEPLNMAKYFAMPELIGDYRVNYHHFLMKDMQQGGMIVKFKLSPKGVQKIITECKKKEPIEFKQHLDGMGLNIPNFTEHTLKSRIYEYNPHNIPSPKAFINPNGTVTHIWIDSQRYAIAQASLVEEDLEKPDDGGLDELFER